MVIIRQIVFGLFISLCSVQVYAAAWAFTVSGQPLTQASPQVHVCTLNPIGTSTIPLDFQSPDAVHAWVTQHSNALARFSHARICQFQASLLGIQFLPAVVQAPYVVYGETDIAKALSRINAYQSAQKTIRGVS